ncbi:MAG: prepilin-type N-terminal cleavage/methylation domain-containing protein [Cyanobacteriota bacterium]
MLRRRRHWRHRSPRAAFSLVELLISAAIGSLVVAGAAAALTAHIRSSTNLEFTQMMRNDLGRISFLLETEVREGASISTAQQVDCLSDGTTSQFTITVPQLGSTGATLASANIHYYASGSGSTATLARCGPPINNNGTLNFAGTRLAAAVSTNTTLAVSASTPTSVTYDLTLRDPQGDRAVTRSAITNRVGSTLIN